MNKSSARTMEILSYLADKKTDGAGISEISRNLDIPKSCVSDILHTMFAYDFIQYANEDLKKYKLGVRTFQIGLTALNDLNILQLSKQFTMNLHKKTNMTVLLAIENNNQVIYIDKIEENVPYRISIDIGDVKPMHLTGVGKAILAAYTDNEIMRKLGDGCYTSHTPKSISTYYSLIKNINNVRNKGYAIENFEENNYIFGIAAPIFDRYNKICGAIEIAMIHADYEKSDIDNIAQNVLNTANEISKILGSQRNKY